MELEPILDFPFALRKLALASGALALTCLRVPPSICLVFDAGSAIAYTLPFVSILIGCRNNRLSRYGQFPGFAPRLLAAICFLVAGTECLSQMKCLAASAFAAIDAIRSRSPRYWLACSARC